MSAPAAVPGSSPRYSVQYMNCFQSHYAKKVKKNCITDASGTKFMEKHKHCPNSVCRFPNEDYKTEYSWQELASFKKDSAASKMVDVSPLEMIDILAVTLCYTLRFIFATSTLTLHSDVAFMQRLFTRCKLNFLCNDVFTVAKKMQRQNCRCKS